MGTTEEEQPVTASPGDDSGDVGEQVEQVGIRGKTTGRAVYGSDIVREGMLHAAVLRSRQTHARIVEMDTSGAADVDGVHCVRSRTELMGLFDDRVRHHGDVIAAVAAEDEGTARDALEEIEYELEPLDAVYDAREAVREGAPEIHENNPDLKQHERHPISIENDEFVNNVDDYHAESVGDVEAGFEEADVVLEGEYQSPRVNHCNLDTHCSVAEWEGDTLVLTETIASPGRVQETLADFLGIDQDNVRLQLPQTASSSFGGRSIAKPTLEPVVATLSRETDRPVKLWFDREEEFQVAETRHRTYYTIKAGVTEDGDLTALTIDTLTDTGGYPNGIGHIVLSNGRDRPLELYRVENYEYEGVSVFTNNIPAGEYRGIGSTQLTYALESHMDELAREAGIDPREFRERNFVEKGYERPHTGLPIESCGLRECLDRGYETFEARREGGSSDSETIRSWGFAAGTHTTATGAHGKDSTEAGLTLKDDGTVLASTAAVEHGQGSSTVMAQIIRRETGIPMRIIEVERFSTTDELKDVLGSVGSRSTYIIGEAVRRAAITFADRIRERAAEYLDCSPEDVDISGDSVTGPDGESLPLADLVDGPDDTIEVVGRAESDLNPPAYGIHFVEIEIDRRTGNVDIPTYIAAQDVGFAINPEGVEGQLEGAVLHGLEFALNSEVKLDRGNPVNANLADYPAISPFEMPDDLTCEIIESNEETGPYGAKGIGTPAMPPIAPAVMNALRNATGRRFGAAPVESEEIYNAIQEGGE